MLIVHNHFIVLANDIPAIVALDSVSSHRLTGFRIVNRLNLLRRSSLAASIDSRCFNRPKNTAGRAAWPTSDEPHDRTKPRGRLWRYHLIEHLWRHTGFDSRLHQLAFHVANCR